MRQLAPLQIRFLRDALRRCARFDSAQSEEAVRHLDEGDWTMLALSIESLYRTLPRQASERITLREYTL